MEMLEYGIKEYCLTELLEMANIDPSHLTYSNLTEYLNTISEHWQIKYYDHSLHFWITNPIYNVKYVYNEIVNVVLHSTRHSRNVSFHEIFLYAVPAEFVIKTKQTIDIKNNTYKKLKEII